MANIALKGDAGSHGGVITVSNQDGTLKVGGVEVAVDGATLLCAQHGPQPVTASAIKSLHNNKLMLVNGDVANCGAIIIAPDRKVYVE